ncbi:muramoyltetrapeptide carboxypeptidase [Erwinia psidii]|uniref:Muramoyltetrapeptide carboxypeptidase n=1 Tax=Erwinia psidii TaxID=69224 RepID=A0A3N6RYY1_9GAMM|nr:muramoyltetrapeptide carboxypeptidase [Erwinia psidii]MCX8955823.1 muramoyltetrapeptide carboxypeptidase [Erwinia psidii]MCX8961620.1 muramoyltetrapeptide carboxypeptidase [Erwinia psidii]MCX8965720.1 muramoyltetrapeptide carboxypeptidase [Erwinia psidii]RQM37657.1 muramoyltetrapeptide carboxypeptidase [Erwinia psidii]
MSVIPRSFHLIAPSGYCHNQQAASLAVERLRSQGHQVENTAVITRREQRFAGSDSERLADLHQLIQPDCQPDIVLAVRGGYGAGRLLPHFNAHAVAARLKAAPLAICGHSDFTVLQMALLQQGAITFSGPMLAGNFGAEKLSDFTIKHFWHALTSPEFTLEWAADTQQTIDLDGTIWGGNLTMLASLAGTPWMPDISDGILVIEDVNEHPFRVERMLLQLAQAGVLARQKAIITGSFTGATLTEYDHGYDFDSVWTLIGQLTELPLVTGLKFGHHWHTVTLPLGAHARLQVNMGHSTLTLSGHPTLP